jgi:Asp-tRNA(Asn)/Glu-tRNA(Gln) amidotransferase A subunit family amidase
VPRHLLKSGVHPDVLKNFEAALEKLRTQGYEIVDIELPSAGLALAIYYISDAGRSLGKLGAL